MTGLLADSVCKEHTHRPRHPERPERFDAALGALTGLDLAPLEPRVANEDEIALCHSRSYIRLVEREVMTGFHELSTGDTIICPRSLDAALRATGGVLNAVDAVLRKARPERFLHRAPARPSRNADARHGLLPVQQHRDRGALRPAKYGVDRVLIADWDVHHGNGTQDIFYTDGSVFFFSTHQHPWYPGTGLPDETGEDKGEGMILNCPFPAGSGRKEILGAFQERLMPAAEGFKPELVLISAGFDSRDGRSAR